MVFILNNYNNNFRKSKLNSSYLIVGIDVAKNKQYARVTDFDGNELGKRISFNRDIVGLTFLLNHINLLKQQYNKKSVLVVMEPTGIYWRNIYYGIKELDKTIETALVNINDVINVRKLFFGNIKTDIVDSLAIAKTAVLKGYKQQIELSENEIEIKDLTTFREKLIKNSVKIKNTITNIMDEIFPEYKRCYANYFCKSSLVLLSEIASPQDIVNVDINTLYRNIKAKSNTCVSLNKLTEIKSIAQSSIGTKITCGKKYELNFNLKTLQELLDQIDLVNMQVAELLKDNEIINNMKEIQGINIISAANILSEIGSFDKFKSYKQLISYCGFNLKIKESGTHKGKATISKQGNARLRAYLFRVMLPIISHNKEFKELHEHYKTRKDNPLKPMQSLVAIICKLLRILWGMSKHKVKYDPKTAFMATSVAIAA